MKIKKLMLSAAVASLALATPLALVACNNDSKTPDKPSDTPVVTEHTHEYGAWSLGLPTCAAAGAATKVCSGCAEDTEGKVVEKPLPILDIDTVDESTGKTDNGYTLAPVSGTGNTGVSVYTVSYDVETGSTVSFTAYRITSATATIASQAVGDSLYILDIEAASGSYTVTVEKDGAAASNVLLKKAQGVVNNPITWNYSNSSYSFISTVTGDAAATAISVKFVAAESAELADFPINGEEYVSVSGLEDGASKLFKLTVAEGGTYAFTSGTNLSPDDIVVGTDIVNVMGDEYSIDADSIVTPSKKTIRELEYTLTPGEYYIEIYLDGAYKLESVASGEIGSFKLDEVNEVSNVPEKGSVLYSFTVTDAGQYKLTTGTRNNLAQVAISKELFENQVDNALNADSTGTEAGSQYAIYTLETGVYYIEFAENGAYTLEKVSTQYEGTFVVGTEFMIGDVGTGKAVYSVQIDKPGEYVLTTTTRVPLNTVSAGSALDEETGDIAGDSIITGIPESNAMNADYHFTFTEAGKYYFVFTVGGEFKLSEYVAVENTFSVNSEDYIAITVPENKTAVCAFTVTDAGQYMLTTGNRNDLTFVAISTSVTDTGAVDEAIPVDSKGLMVGSQYAIYTLEAGDCYIEFSETGSYKLTKIPQIDQNKTFTLGDYLGIEVPENGTVLCTLTITEAGDYMLSSYNRNNLDLVAIGKTLTEGGDDILDSYNYYPKSSGRDAVVYALTEDTYYVAIKETGTFMFEKVASDEDNTFVITTSVNDMEKWNSVEVPENGHKIYTFVVAEEADYVLSTGTRNNLALVAIATGLTEDGEIDNDTVINPLDDTYTFHLGMGVHYIDFQQTGAYKIDRASELGDVDFILNQYIGVVVPENGSKVYSFLVDYVHAGKYALLTGTRNDLTRVVIGTKLLDDVSAIDASDDNNILKPGEDGYYTLEGDKMYYIEFVETGAYKLEKVILQGNVTEFTLGTSLPVEIPEFGSFIYTLTIEEGEEGDYILTSDNRNDLTQVVIASELEEDGVLKNSALVTGTVKRTHALYHLAAGTYYIEIFETGSYKFEKYDVAAAPDPLDISESIVINALNKETVFTLNIAEAGTYTITAATGVAEEDQTTLGWVIGIGDYYEESMQMSGGYDVIGVVDPEDGSTLTTASYVLEAGTYYIIFTAEDTYTIAKNA